MRSDLGSLRRQHGADLLIVGLCVSAIVEFVVFRGRGSIPDGSLVIAVPAVCSMTLPLLARRRFPFSAPAVAITSSAAFAFFEGHVTPHLFFTFLAGLTIAFLFAYLNDQRMAVAGLLLTWTMANVATWRDAVTPAVGDIVFVLVVHGLAWAGGLVVNRRMTEARAVQERLVDLEREREERAREAVATERARIARELHDVVGHHVSVMTVQAGAVRRLLRADQQRERESLEAVEQSGREALAEMRRMVGVLRRPEQTPALAPQPSLEQLQKLVDQTREAGLRVELRIEGEPVRLPTSLDLTAYRIVQEALTNTLKHAQARTAYVVVRYTTRGVELTVDDDGTGTTSGSGAGTGNGHVGMRERVAVYGGDFDAGPRPGGGFRLRARLPLGAP